jgi:peptidoglycan/xylan/chitin deacetylase (PgdA/CDA1 family)
MNDVNSGPEEVESRVEGLPNSLWPDGLRCAVAITFDLDGECVPLVYDRPNAYRRLSLLSDAAYEFTAAVPLLAGLLERHRIVSTFFVPGFTAELHPKAIRELARQGHEIGHHGYYHEATTSLTDPEERELFESARVVIEEASGERLVGHRAPGWEMKPTTPDLLKSLGMAYDSSLMGHYLPYRVGRPDGLIELPVHWSLDDTSFYGYLPHPKIGSVIADPANVLAMWKQDFLAFRQLGGLFVLTLHGRHLRPARWAMLDELLAFIAAFDDVWVASMSQIALWLEGNPAVPVVDYPQAYFAAASLSQDPSPLP